MNPALRRAAWLLDLRRVLLDLLFPPRCASCGRAGDWFCASCRAHVQPLPPLVCAHCALPLAAGSLCERCRREPSSLVRIRAAACYAGPLRAAILRLKFHGWQAVAEPLGEYLWQAWQQEPLPVEALVPVPADGARLRARGYNQAALLAHVLARRVGKPVWDGALARTRPTARQVELTSAQRWQNVAGAFRCQDGTLVHGRAVLLIDDICTTGATLEACGAALRAAGARAVWGLVLARTVIPSAEQGEVLLPDATDAEWAMTPHTA